MGIHNGFGNGQPKPRAAVFACARRIAAVEPFKHMGNVLSRDPGAIVPHRQFSFRAPGSQADMNSSLVSIGMLYRILE
ncbi:hypothetical protein D3C79_1005480 [compost metagenome]